MSDEHIPETHKPEFSHPVALSEIPGDGTFEFDLHPDAAVLVQLAGLFDATSVAKLRFKGTLGYDAFNRLEMQSTLGVTVTQTCVVTLKPVKTRIDETIRRFFMRDYGIDDGEYEIKADGDEDLELLSDPIDLGVIATEAIALALPTYPRAEGAELEAAQFAAPGIAPLKPEDMKPFASLAALREKLLKEE